MPARDDEQQTHYLTKVLLEGIGEKRTYRPKSLDIYVADVEAAIDRFDYQMRWCRANNLRFPCLVDIKASPIPLDLSNSPYGVELVDAKEGFWHWFPLDRPFEAQSYLGDFRYELFGPREVTGFLKEGLFRFLFTRFKARKSDISKSPGIWFCVRTQTHGLRVHYTPSYFINWSGVFRSPTSPVHGCIQPGLYKFGVMGRDYPFRFDPADFSIPPRKEAELFL